LLADGDTISVDSATNTPSSVITGALVSAAAQLQASATVTGFLIADSASNESAGLAGLAGDSKLLLITLTDSSTPTLSLTAAQFTADTVVLAKIASSYNLTVTGALASGAASLQANAQVTSFSITDSFTHVSAALASLAADSKLSAITLTDTTASTLTLTAAQYRTDASLLAHLSGPYSLTITGTTGSDTVNLTGSNVPVAINLAGNSAVVSVSAGLAAPTLKFLGAPDAVTLGNGAATISDTLSSGVETIANFQLGTDWLDLSFNGTFTASNTSVGGVHAVAIYSSASPKDGVVLTGTTLTAANVLSHTSFSSGMAVVH